MQSVYSIWIQPQQEVCKVIDDLRRTSKGLDLSYGLPPWFLLLQEDFSPPSPPEYPYWLPRHRRVSDQIMRRDRSSHHYQAPRLSIATRTHYYISAFPGVISGLPVELLGGKIPDLRLYSGNFRSLPPLLTDSPLLILPLSWKQTYEQNNQEVGIVAWKGGKKHIGEIRFKAGTIVKMPIQQTRACSIHLVETTIQYDKKERASIVWQSLAEIDLVK